MLQEVQSWWEVPCIAHFCSLFRASFALPDFDIEELEEALLTEEPCGGLLQELLLRLLAGCEGAEKHELSSSNYQMFLRRLFRRKCQEDVTRKNPFDSDSAFLSLPLRTKVEILAALCDFRLDADDIPELLKSIEAESLRVEPLGQDSGGSTYWYFYGTRLYREDYTPLPKGPPKKRGRGTTPGTVSKWQVVCYTEQDWQLLASKFKNCKHKDERLLHQTLKEDFLPELARLFAEKQRLIRSRVMDKQLRRKKVVVPTAAQKAEEDEKARRREQEQADHRLAQQIQREERQAGLHLRERRGAGSRPQSLPAPPPPPPPKRTTNNSLSTPLPPPTAAEVAALERSSKDKKARPKKPPPKKPPPPIPSSLLLGEEEVEVGMHKVVEALKAHRDAWPFLGPVDEDYAPNYYQVIPRPMDLSTIEDKLDNGDYLTLDAFRQDFALLVANCRQYNGETSEYTEMVEGLEEAFEKAVKRFILPDESDDDTNDFAAAPERKRPRLSSSPRTKPSRPPPTPSDGSEASESEASAPPKRDKQRKEKPSGGKRPKDRRHGPKDRHKRKAKRLTTQTLKSVEEKWKKAAEARKAEAEAAERRRKRDEETLRRADPKQRPVKKRPRPPSPSPRRPSTPPSPLPPPPPDPQKDLRQRFDQLKSEVTAEKRKESKSTGPRKKGPKDERRVVPFKAAAQLKRLQVGKATKFKIPRPASQDMDHSKTREVPGARDEPAEAEKKDKKRCLLLADPPPAHSPALSFGSILPKHALPLAHLRPRPDEEPDEEPAPAPLSQQDIIERLEKTFGASLAPHTKDTLAKVILAPDAPPEPAPPPPPPPEPPAPSPPPAPKSFNREKSLPNLSAWFKAFGLPGKSDATSSEGPKPPSSKFMVMGKGIGGTTTAQHSHAPPEERWKEDERKDEDGERRRRVSSSSSQSESPSPAAPRWAEGRGDWGSPSASSHSHVSPQAQQPASPFSPQTPLASPQQPSPRSPAPVRVGFYQDYAASPDKTPELNVASPATPPTPTAHVYNLAPPAAHKDEARDFPPLRAHPEYRPEDTLHRPKPEVLPAEMGLGGGAYPPTPTPTPPSYHAPMYGIPEAHANAHHSSSHHSGARYAHSQEPQAAHSQEPQAAHSQARQQHPSPAAYTPAPYAHQHSHPPPSRSMPVYNNPNERLYKRSGEAFGLASALTLTPTPAASGGRRKTDKEPNKDLNGCAIQWPHNLASLSHIVNSIPGAYYAHHAEAHAAAGPPGYTAPARTPEAQDNNASPRRSAPKAAAPAKSSSSRSSGKSGVPGSAFNFSGLAPAELALFSKEMSDYAAPTAHHTPYPAATPSFTSFGSTRPSPTPPVPYQLAPFSAYGAASTQFQGSAARPMVDPYLFPTGSHVFFSSSGAPSPHYPPPYPHPHALPYRQGWL